MNDDYIEKREKCKICNGLGEVMIYNKLSMAKSKLTCPVCFGIGNIDWITKIKENNIVENFNKSKRHIQHVLLKNKEIRNVHN